jgi:gamma-glutamylcyclotransferase
MKLYFAYGSNMWKAQMAKRCPQSRKIGVARLIGYRWIITTRGYASVVLSPADTVEGVLYEISGSDEDALDGFEGVRSGLYVKQFLPVHRDGKQELALIYVDPITAEGAPQQEYIDRINAGLADANLNDGYVIRYMRKFIPA